jgi:hypothetical protein
MSEYSKGFKDGWNAGLDRYGPHVEDSDESEELEQYKDARRLARPPKPKRKLSAWNKFVKANSKKPRFKYKSGAKKGKLNLKAMAVAFRRTPAGKKKKK